MRGPEGPGGGGAKKTQPAETPPKDLRGNDELLPTVEAEVSPKEWKYGSESPVSKPESSSEKKAELARAVTAVQEELARHANVAEERGAMLSAEKAYLAAYKELHRLGLGKADSGPAAENAAELKQAYDAARLVYAEKLTASAEERWEKAGLTREEVARRVDRYNRLVRFNEIVKPTAELRLRARTEGLNEKGRSGWQKGLAWFGKGNQWLEAKAGKKGARVIRAAASAVIVSGGAATAGAFGSVVLLGMASYGALKFARTLGGGLIGEGTAKVYEKTLGRSAQEKAKKGLAMKGRADALNADSLAALDEAREKLAKKSSDATLARNKTIAKVLGGVVGGASLTELVNLGVLQEAAAFAAAEAGQAAGVLHGASFMNAAEAATPTSLDGAGGHLMESTDEVMAKTAFPAYEPPSDDLGAHALSEAYPKASFDTPSFSPEVAAHGISDPLMPQGAAVSEAVAHHGAGGIRLIKELRGSLGKNGLTADTSPALARLYHMDPEKLAQQLGLYHPGAEGGLENIKVPEGSTFAYTNDGEVVLTLKGGDAVTLIDSAGHIAEHKGAVGDFIGLHHTEHVMDTPHEAPGIDHGSADTRALNDWVLAHPGETPPADILHHAAPEAQASTAVAPASGVRTLQDFVNAPKPSAGEVPPAVIPPVSASSSEGIRTLGDFANMHESVLEPSAAHAYESVRGEYLWGGTGNLDDAAQRLAYEHHASVFVNHSYNDPLRGRVVSVTEFRPFGEGGKALPPVVHTESAYDLDPERDFTKRIN